MSNEEIKKYPNVTPFLEFIRRGHLLLDVFLFTKGTYKYLIGYVYRTRIGDFYLN